MSLRERISTPEGKRRYVRALFRTIAGRYDFITVLLSFGQDRGWKRQLVDRSAAGPGCRALDLATGTGDIAFELGRRQAAVVGLDVTLPMVQIASGKRQTPSDPVFVAGDMAALPFPAASFDLITTGYGLRNVPDLTVAIDEIVRVLKPGGQALSLDFDRPQNRWVRAVYLAYLSVVGSVVGWVLHRDSETYRYIAASLATYPGASAVAELMQARGFASVRHHRVLGGLMAIHHGVKP